MQKVAEILFFVSWLLCGCTVDTFFDGGAPIFFASLLIAAICMAVLSRYEETAP